MAPDSALRRYYQVTPWIERTLPVPGTYTGSRNPHMEMFLLAVKPRTICCRTDFR